MKNNISLLATLFFGCRVFAADSVELDRRTLEFIKNQIEIAEKLTKSTEVRFESFGDVYGLSIKYRDAVYNAEIPAPEDGVEFFGPAIDLRVFNIHNKEKTIIGFTFDYTQAKYANMKRNLFTIESSELPIEQLAELKSLIQGVLDRHRNKLNACIMSLSQ